MCEDTTTGAGSSSLVRVRMCWSFPPAPRSSAGICSTSRRRRRGDRGCVRTRCAMRDLKRARWTSTSSSTASRTGASGRLPDSPSKPVPATGWGSSTRAWPSHLTTLLIGDETAMPAVAGICRSLPRDARGVAIIEIPTAGDRQELSAPAGMEITWIHRDESSQTAARPGELALRALAAAALPDGEVHAHVIGESALATGARRHLVQERDVPKRNVDFVGYWRHGRAATG